jgi:type I restriction enzyme S subunit
MIENIPAGWRVEKLQDITEFLTCGVAKRPQYINKVTGIPFLSSKNVKTNKMLLGDYSLISKEDYKILTKYYKPKKGDILYTRVGSFGEATVVDVDFDFAIFVSLTIIRVKNEVINNRYLSNILNSRYIKQLANEKARGIAVKNLNVGDVRKFLIPIPPIKQQQKIVKVLDITTNLINQQQELLKQYDLFLKSKFIEMFGDPVKNSMGWKVEKLVNLSINNGEYGSSASAIKYNNKKPRYIRITDITNEGCLKSDKKSPSSVDVKYLLNKGDIVFARSGATVGKTYLHNLDNANFQFAGYLIRFIPNKKLVNPIFLFYFTKSNYYNTWVNSKQKVVAQPNINAKEYGSLDIFLPTITLQNKFADIVEKIESIKTQQNKKLLQLQDLHNSLMQKAFKGEIK